ncbi:MAG TPA: hypothetical protein VIX90_04660 [Edaphobacter sp.]
MKIKVAALTVLVVSAVSVLAVSQVAQAGVRVGGSSLRANGQIAEGYQYSGPCSVDLKFGWGVIADCLVAHGHDLYISRSDGGHSSTSRTVDLSQPNRSMPIYDDWRLGANTPQFRNYRGWVQIDIMSPNAVAQKIPFTIHCQ